MQPWKSSPEDGRLLVIITFFLLTFGYFALLGLPMPIGSVVSIILTAIASVTGRLAVIILKG